MSQENNFATAPKNLWSRAYFLRQGAKIGPATRRALDNLLDSKAIEAQGYRSCRNILDMGTTPANAEVLEATCVQLTDDTGRRRAITYTAVKDAMARIRAAADRRPTTTGSSVTTARPGYETITGRITRACSR